jgi:hypothetical protein
VHKKQEKENNFNCLQFSDRISTKKMPQRSDMHNIIVKCDPATGFDSTFSLHLTNHMSPQEYQQHIQQLNTIWRTYNRKYAALIYLMVVMFLVVFVVVVPVLTMVVWYNLTLFIACMVFYVVALFSAMFIYIIYVRNGQAKFTSHAKAYLNSINQNFIPRGVQWRLNSEIVQRGRYGVTTYYLTIEIMQPSSAAPPGLNMGFPQYQNSSGFPPQQNPYFAVPPQQQPPQNFDPNYQYRPSETLVTL